MARILNAKFQNTHVVWEDPRANSSTIYLYGDAHDLSTLSPIFGATISTRTDGYTFTQIGNNNTPLSTSNDQGYNAGRVGAALFLTKDTTHVRHTLATGNNDSTNVDYTFAASMNPDYPARVYFLQEDGSRSALVWTMHSASNTWSDSLVWTNPGEEFYNESPARIYSYTGFNGFSNNTSIGPTYAPKWYFYYNSTESALSGMAAERFSARYSTGNSAGVIRPVKLHSFPDFAQITFTNASQSHYISQFLGPSAQGDPLYFYNLLTTNDHTQKVVRHNMSTDTTTDVYTFNTAPTAAGTSQGGTRDLVAGTLRTQGKVSCHIMDDPSSAGNKCWYTPFFDINNNYHPFFYQWNVSTDVITRNDDVSVVDSNGVAAGSSAHIINLPGTSGNFSYQQSLFYNEQFTANSKNFLMLILINGAYRAHDGQESMRTFVTYEIDPLDPKNLIEHSTLKLNATPRNIVWLNDARTLLGVFYETAFGIYNFTDATGWVESTVINQQFWAVGRDRNDRIWAAAYSASGFADVHLITPALPVTIKIVAENATYNYQGTTITSFITLEAINAQGNRIETDVTLVIDGFTMTFGDDTKSKIVTTSSTAAVNVPIKIIDSGFSSIISSVTL